VKKIKCLEMSPRQIVLTNHAHIAHIIRIYLYTNSRRLRLVGTISRFVLFYFSRSTHYTSWRRLGAKIVLFTFRTRLVSREKIARVRVIFQTA